MRQVLELILQGQGQHVHHQYCVGVGGRQRDFKFVEKVRSFFRFLAARIGAFGATWGRGVVDAPPSLPIPPIGKIAPGVSQRTRVQSIGSGVHVRCVGGEITGL